MILVTVTNQAFVASTFNLIESYRHFSFNDKILVYDFGIKESSLKAFNDFYGDQVSIKKVEPVCLHSHKPRTFFYKAYALNDASKFNKDFIYSDAANSFVSPSDSLRGDVKKSGRLFLPYTAEGLSNKYWTTKKCFEKMSCDTQQYHDSPQYWAGFQAYLNTEENKRFISEMYSHMLDPDIAEPDTTVSRPDGYGGPCVEHRQDQSVFSLLIKKYQWDQPYNEGINNKYGDLSTFSDWEEGFNYDEDEVVLSARFSKFGNLRYAPLDAINNL